MLTDEQLSELLTDPESDRIENTPHRASLAKTFDAQACLGSHLDDLELDLFAIL